jgi:hypothetical protein
MRNDSKDEGRNWVMSLSHASVSTSIFFFFVAAPTTMMMHGALPLAVAASSSPRLRAAFLHLPQAVTAGEDEVPAAHGFPSVRSARRRAPCWSAVLRELLCAADDKTREQDAPLPLFFALVSFGKR